MKQSPPNRIKEIWKAGWLAAFTLFLAMSHLNTGTVQGNTPAPLGNLAPIHQAQSSADVDAAVNAAVARLQSTNIKERARAIMTLRRRESTAAIPALIRMLGSETEFPEMELMISSMAPITQSSFHKPTFGGEAAETLAHIGTLSDDLLALLNSTDWPTRANAARALGGLKDGRATGMLIAMLSRADEPWQVRGNAALALGLIEDRRAVQPLLAALQDQNAGVRAAAASTLGAFRVPGSLESLVRALKDPESDVRVNSVISIGNIGGTAAVESLMQALQDNEKTVREVAAGALGRAGDPRAVSALLVALQDDYINVRINAARALGELHRAEAVESLIRMLTNDESILRRAAADALGELNNRDAVNALVNMVMSENGWDWEITVASGLRALSKLGHGWATVALKRYTQHSPDWKEWWSENKTQLLSP